MSTRAKPMQLLCKLIGLAPYSFDPGSSEFKFRTSKFGFFYSLFISVLLTWFGILNYRTIHDNLTSGSYVTIGAQWLQFYINNGFSVLIVIANSLQQWKVVEAFNVIYDSKNEPKKLFDHRERGREVFYGIATVLTTISLHLTTTLTSYFDNEKRIDYYWFPYGILFLLNTLVVLQFLCGVVKLGRKFQALNIRLQDLISQQRGLTVNHNHKDGMDSEVKIAAEEHLKLIDKTNLLISAFSYQLFLCFVAALIISVSGLYLICKRIIQRTVDASTFPDLMRERSYNWWCLSCYPLLHSVLLGGIITVCQWTVNQANSLNGILPRIERVFQLSHSANIDSFAHQLLLQPISFNVFQIFTISSSMVCSIISTVLTYLIILVQFEISQDTESSLEMDTLNSGAGPPMGPPVTL